MLYKTLADLMTFVDICRYFPLYLMFIVWLRFVNHLLNYYLLTYNLLGGGQKNLPVKSDN